MYVPHFVYQFIFNGHLGCFHVVAIVRNTTMNMGVQISVQVSVFNLSGIYPEVELLDCMVVLFLIFWGISIPFSIPFMFPPAVYKGTNFPTCSPTLVVFIIAILMCLTWYLTMVLICISLMINHVEHLFMCLLAKYPFSYPNVFDMISHYGFDLHFPDD